MSLLVSIGECMLELSAAEDDLWHLGIAGDTFNTAWYARALLPKAWEVSYATRLGTDPFSDRAAAFIAANGISTRHITRHPTRSIGLYAISLHKGERSFTYWRDSSAARTLMEATDALQAAVDAARVIHVSGITLAILPPQDRARLVQMLAAARQRGAVTVLDPNHRPRLWPDAATARQALSAAAQACTIILPSFDDEAALFNDATPEATLARYAALGAETIVVKNGGDQIALRHQGQTRTLTGLPKVTPLDTTGAGDSFNGAFLAALMTGQSPEGAARRAHDLAAHVVRHRGALIPMGDLQKLV